MMNCPVWPTPDAGFGTRFVASLGLPTPLTIERLHSFVETKLGRDIIVDRSPGTSGGSGPTGIWFSMANHNSDLIWIENRIDEEHQTQSLLHEYGHIVLGHPARPLSKVQIAEVAIPRRVLEATGILCRGNASTPQEQEAERVADALQFWLNTPTGPVNPASGFGRFLQ